MNLSNANISIYGKYAWNFARNDNSFHKSVILSSCRMHCNAVACTCQGMQSESQKSIIISHVKLCIANELIVWCAAKWSHQVNKFKSIALLNLSAFVCQRQTIQLKFGINSFGWCENRDKYFLIKFIHNEDTTVYSCAHRSLCNRIVGAYKSIFAHTIQATIYLHWISLISIFQM